MTVPEESEQLERLARRFAPGAKLLRAWELSGGTSARVAALEIEHPDGRTQKLIARRHGAVDLARNPHLAADEFKLLHFLHLAGFPAPAPLHLDESGAIFGMPCLVVAYIDGGPAPALPAAPDLLQQLAAQLAALHRLDGTPSALAFLPAQAEHVSKKLSTRPATPDESLDESRIRDTLQAVWPLPGRNPPVLLHGDFWPGNTLWQDGKLVAVIDWEDAALGDPLGDLARSRLEILWAFGAGAMHAFTQAYLVLNPLDAGDLPYWDLCAALRQVSSIAGWGLDAATEQRFRAGLRLFSDQAFEQLPAGPVQLAFSRKRPAAATLRCTAEGRSE